MNRYACPRCERLNCYGGNPYPCSVCGFDGRRTHIVGAVSQHPADSRYVERIFAPVREAVEELKRREAAGE